jgi:hypothetical protein
MHESLLDNVSFGLDNDKFLEVVVDCLISKAGQPLMQWLVRYGLSQQVQVLVN